MFPKLKLVSLSNNLEKNQIPSFYSSRDLILKVMGGKASNILFFLPFQKQEDWNSYGG